jgi:uncharacterized radical SAM protein YgiQ
VNHQPQIELLQNARKIPGVKKVFVASGVRYDMLLCDLEHGNAYLRELVNHHISGQMKVAPEHTADGVLKYMGKPGNESLMEFKNRFDSLNHAAGKRQFLTYYLIAAHPGCTESDMQRLRAFTSQKLQIHPEQVQIFTPTPSTYSSLMYYTELDPFSGDPIFVEKDAKRKERQKQIVTDKELNSGHLFRGNRPRS